MSNSFFMFYTVIARWPSNALTQKSAAASVARWLPHYQLHHVTGIYHKMMMVNHNKSSKLWLFFSELYAYCS